MTTPINTHELTVDFGKHKGERYVHVPVGYLRWMVNEGHPKAVIAEAELNRRGLPLANSDFEISGHAIDTASLRVRKTWHETKNENEGIHAWLKRIVQEAWERDEPDDRGRLYRHNIIMVVEPGQSWVTVKTVMRDKKSG